MKTQPLLIIVLTAFFGFTALGAEPIKVTVSVTQNRNTDAEVTERYEIPLLMSPDFTVPVQVPGGMFRVTGTILKKEGQAASPGETETTMLEIRMQASPSIHGATTGDFASVFHAVLPFQMGKPIQVYNTPVYNLQVVIAPVSD